MRRGIITLLVILAVVSLIGIGFVEAKGFSSGGGARSFGGGARSFSGSSISAKSTVIAKSPSVSVSKPIIYSSSSKITSTPKITRTASTPYKYKYHSGTTFGDMLPYLLIAYGAGVIASDDDGDAVYVTENGTKVELEDENGKDIPYNQSNPQSPLGVVPALFGLGAGAAWLARRRLNA